MQEVLLCRGHHRAGALDARRDVVAAAWNAAEAHSMIVAICMAGPIAHSSSARHRGEDPAG